MSPLVEGRAFTAEPKESFVSGKSQGDGSWRRTNLITHHRDHLPQVKVLVDELYATLSENGRRDYEAMIKGEYAGPHEHVEHHAYGDGLLSLIAEPTRDPQRMRLTHLVYGGCTAHQVRQDLVSRGLGSLGITWVYPPEADLSGE
ncbi:hypothetical protein [Amycolatopsis orientalis]|uniref:hypothetical protein n=1 Tax=Amycolatopsis orientalis TaxID=31958 RepID=UPI000411B743|nr:hypothetical protein [Amycolatopsis orientalis]